MRPIDADALKDVIQQHDYPLADRLNSIDNGMFTLGIFQAIDEQPTLSPDDLRPVVHGRWEQNHPNDNIFYCNQCAIPNDTPTNYCPNCGAAMLKGE